MIEPEEIKYYEELFDKEGLDLCCEGFGDMAGDCYGAYCTPDSVLSAFKEYKKKIHAAIEKTKWQQPVCGGDLDVITVDEFEKELGL